LIHAKVITLYEGLKLFICYYKVRCSNRYCLSYTSGCAQEAVFIAYHRGDCIARYSQTVDRVNIFWRRFTFSSHNPLLMTFVTILTRKKVADYLDMDFSWVYPSHWMSNVFFLLVLVNIIWSITKVS